MTAVSMQKSESTAPRQAPGGAPPSGGPSFQISPPAINIPKGGGAIRGIGEKFAANPVTGTGSMTVPIATSPGRSGFGPQLSLSYDSGSGNGPFGFGWSLSLPSITRKTDKGLPQYQDASASDVFILSGAEDLVPLLVQDPTPRVVGEGSYQVERYSPRIEGLFAGIERWTDTKTGETHWRSISRDNVTTLYGKDNNSRIFDPADPDPQHPTRIFCWLICESYDDKGNAIVYEYAEENDHNIDLTQVSERNRAHSANRYPKRIKYGNRVPRHIQPDLTQAEWLFEVVFDYDEGHVTNELTDGEQQTFVESSSAATNDWSRRLDPFSSYRAGFEVRTYRLCQRVLMFHHMPELATGEKGYEGLVRSTDFTYARAQDPTTARGPVYTFLRSVTQTGYRLDGTRYLKRSLPPVEFEYSQPAVQDAVENVEGESLENLPAGLDGAGYQWTDLHGEGIPGFLSEQAGAWFYKRNLSPLNVQWADGVPHVEAKFAPVELVAAKPNLALAGGQAQFMDLAGDGQPDLVVLDGPMPGLFEHDDGEGWQPFRPLTARLTRDLRDPNLKFIDLDGDGHADILITEDDAFVWHPSRAVEGFGPARRVPQVLDEENGPRLVFADGTQSVYLADLSGDGLTDLARIRNGEVCYWPNLGYGRFGAKVTMDHAPYFDQPDQFDHKHLRLADIDGTGTTDLIYLHRDGVQLYFNQSGNSWSEPRLLRVFPRVDDLVSVVPTDLLGNGTACLVWSSPLPGAARRPMRYVNLIGRQKPHLLVKTVNNLGAETRIQYAPSTQFYLQDKRDGSPWITRLPFPVHVVERVETDDQISRSRFVTRYAYHHGYFDGEEREFRGFGMVEQWDTEEFAALTADGTLPEAANLDTASNVPPVHIKTWFHTGFYTNGESISRQFEQEYFREPGLDVPEFEALLLPDTTLPPDLTLEEEREACRALKGVMLRQEVYADDAPPGSSEATIRRARAPYTVVEQNFTIRTVQRRAGNPHAVFFTHPCETITYQYERSLIPVLNGQIVDEAKASPDSKVEWLPDPRVQHTLTLEVDDFGNVLKSASVGYGRRFDAPDDVLVPEDRDRQRLIHFTYTENSFTNPIVDQADAYRTPLPCETRTYELRKPEQEKSSDGPTHPYRFDDAVGFVKQSGDGKHDVDYEDIHFDQAKKDPKEAKSYFRRLIEHVRTLYRTDDLTHLLPLGTLQSMALPGETYRLAFTPGLLTQVYQRPLDVLSPPGAPPSEPLLSEQTSTLPAGLPRDQVADLGGYRSSQALRSQNLFPASPADSLWTRSDAAGHWWIPSGRIFYAPYDVLPPHTFHDVLLPRREVDFALQHFFLPCRYRDPFHTDAVSTETVITYDAYDLLVVATRDAVGNVVTTDTQDDDRQTAIRMDYRVLQPYWVTDPNGNRTRVSFDALGMVVGTAVMGKPGEKRGDSLDGFESDLTRGQINEFYEADDPHNPAAKLDLLKNASTRILYDLDRFGHTKDANPKDPTRWEPAYAATLARETHVSDTPEGGPKVQISFSYSDGFGQEIQKKIQAGPERLVKGKSDVSPRWVGSGWTIFNNKGKPVRQYEPFFSQLPAKRHQFEFGVQVGVSPILFYDPLERVVATLHPDHSYEKVVFDAWRQQTYDRNDTLNPTSRYDPLAPDALPDPAFDPASDPDVGDFFARLPRQEYLPTWYDLRLDPAKALSQWPDATMRNNQKQAAERAAHHSNTPTVTYLDALGRAVLTVDDNGLDKNGRPQRYRTRIELDIEGNQRSVTDALGRKVIVYHYDMLGNRTHQASMEAGERWMLNDVAGKPLYAWDSRGHTFHTEYDALRRPLRSWVEGPDLHSTDHQILYQRTVYGETHPDSLPGPSNEPPALKLNLRGKVFLQLDSAGAVTYSGPNPQSHDEEAYDFKGNLLRSERRLATEFKEEVDWKSLEAALNVKTLDVEALNSQLAPLLESDTFQTSTTFDALNRPITTTAPDGSVYRPSYNEANLLDKVEVNLRGAVTATPFVLNIDYNARGQRELIEYGSGAGQDRQGVTTTYTYDEHTFRLVSLKTTRPAGLNGLASQIFADPTVAQDLRYTYDPAGNIMRIEDSALKTIFHDNEQVDPVSTYTYDALYRLIEAQGREHIGQTAYVSDFSQANRRDYPFAGLDDFKAHPNDTQKLRSYVESYEYDAVGNFTALRHSGHPTRYYDYEEPSLIEHGQPSNRLTRTRLSNGLTFTETYKYTDDDGSEVHGCMTAINDMKMAWDFKGQLHQVDRGGGGTAYYVYDATGQRVRKVIESQMGVRRTERIYLGGFEIYQEFNGNSTAVTLARESLHVMDDQKRITLVETQTIENGHVVGAPAPLQRYQLGNHLGSASVELAEDGALISYEDYHPYGTTAFQAGSSVAESSMKRYRYTGKERDEETGLCYHGARYYAPWLGRWTSCDPKGIADGTSLYQYALETPLRFHDPTGQAAEIPPPYLLGNPDTIDRFAQGAVKDVSHLPVNLRPNVTDFIGELAVENLAQLANLELDRLSIPHPSVVRTYDYDPDEKNVGGGFIPNDFSIKISSDALPPKETEKTYYPGLKPDRTPEQLNRSLSVEEFAGLAATVLHEYEHLAETFQSIRFVLSRGVKPSDVAERLGFSELPDSILKAAAARPPLTPGSQEYLQASAFFHKSQLDRQSVPESGTLQSQLVQQHKDAFYEVIRLQRAFNQLIPPTPKPGHQPERQGTHEELFRAYAAQRAAEDQLHAATRAYAASGYESGPYKVEDLLKQRVFQLLGH
jgi:RHS repeat-associated protein